MANYYDRSEMSRSKLCDLKKSPYYFWRKHIKKDLTETETESFVLGRDIHSKILEPHKFNNEFLVMPKFPHKKEDKMAKAKFLEDNKDRTILTVIQNELLNKIESAFINFTEATILSATASKM